MKTKIVYEVFDNREDYSLLKTFKNLKNAYLYCEKLVNKIKDKNEKDKFTMALSIDKYDGTNSNIFRWFELDKKLILKK